MGTMNYLLMEDDCAPDAREYFDEKFFDIIGKTRREFENSCERVETDDEMMISWSDGKYLLEISADYPFYTLRFVKEDK